MMPMNTAPGPPLPPLQPLRLVVFAPPPPPPPPPPYTEALAPAVHAAELEAPLPPLVDIDVTGELLDMEKL